MNLHEITICATMGKRIEAVAVLLATSVNIEAIKHIRIIMAMGGRAARPDRLCPIQIERPDTLEASEMA